MLLVYPRKKKALEWPNCDLNGSYKKDGERLFLLRAHSDRSVYSRKLLLSLETHVVLAPTLKSLWLVLGAVRPVCQARPVSHTCADDLLDKGARNTGGCTLVPAVLACAGWRFSLGDRDSHHMASFECHLPPCSVHTGSLSPEPATGSSVVPGSASQDPGFGSMWRLIFSAMWPCDSPAGGPEGSGQELGCACCGRAWDRRHSSAGGERRDGDKQRGVHMTRDCKCRTKIDSNNCYSLKCHH